jgi:hypothetical protein
MARPIFLKYTVVDVDDDVTGIGVRFKFSLDKFKAQEGYDVQATQVGEPMFLTEKIPFNYREIASRARNKAKEAALQEGRAKVEQEEEALLASS